MSDQKLARLRESARRVQGNRCCYCQVEMTDAGSGYSTDVTAEHMVPRSWGGRTVRRNIKAACHACNHRRADGAPIHKKSGRKHDRNVRITETDTERQERKRNERMSMWRQACPMR